MSDGRPETDENGGRQCHSDGRSRTPHPVEQPPELRCERVEYSGRTDRCTVYPGGLPDEKLVTTWLSVDQDVMVRLDEWR